MACAVRRGFVVYMMHINASYCARKGQGCMIEYFKQKKALFGKLQGGGNQNEMYLNA